MSKARPHVNRPPNLSRRQFLAHSAGLAGASLGLGFGRAGAAEPGGELRLGFVGLGDRGRCLLGAALRAAKAPSGPRVRIAGLCDVSPRALKRALDLVEAEQPAVEPADRPRGFTHWKGLLDDGSIDAVLIATPVDLHAPQAVTALAAGKHVYCEKPLAPDIEGCREVLAAASAAEAAGLVFQVGFQRRYNPRYRRSVQFVRGGEAGRVLFLRAQWHATGNSPKDKPWLFRRRRSGDIVLEQACHQFDIFNWVFGSPPVRACGFGGLTQFRDEPPGRDTMDHYAVVVEYPGGVRVQLSHVSFAIPDRRFSGIYELVFGDRMGVDLTNAVAWEPGGATRRLCEDSPGNDTELALGGFLTCLATGRKPEADARAGYLATLAALLAKQAIDSGGVAHWKDIEPA